MVWVLVISEAPEGISQRHSAMSSAVRIVNRAMRMKDGWTLHDARSKSLH